MPFIIVQSDNYRKIPTRNQDVKQAFLATEADPAVEILLENELCTRDGTTVTMSLSSEFLGAKLIIYSISKQTLKSAKKYVLCFSGVGDTMPLHLHAAHRQERVDLKMILTEKFPHRIVVAKTQPL